MNTLEDVARSFDVRPYLRAGGANDRRSSWLSPLEGALVFYYEPQAGGPTYIVKTQAPYVVERIQQRIGANVDGRFGDATRRGIVARMRQAGINVPDNQAADAQLLAFALVDTFFGRGRVGFPSPMEWPNIATAPRAAGNSTYFAMVDTMGRPVSVIPTDNGRVQPVPAAPPSTPVPQQPAPQTQPSTTTQPAPAPAPAPAPPPASPPGSQPQGPTQGFVQGQPGSVGIPGMPGAPGAPGAPGTGSQPGSNFVPGMPSIPGAQPGVFTGPAQPGQCPAQYLLLPTGQCAPGASLSLPQLQDVIVQRIQGGIPFTGVELELFAEMYVAGGQPGTAQQIRNLTLEKYGRGKPVTEPVLITQADVDRANIPVWATTDEVFVLPAIPASRVAMGLGLLALAGGAVYLATKD